MTEPNAEYGRADSDAGGYTTPLLDPEHAMLVGVLAGLVMRAKSEGFPYDATVINDEAGNHLARFAIAAPSGQYLVVVHKLSGAAAQIDRSGAP